MFAYEHEKIRMMTNMMNDSLKEKSEKATVFNVTFFHSEIAKNLTKKYAFMQYSVALDIATRINFSCSGIIQCREDEEALKGLAESVSNVIIAQHEDLKVMNSDNMKIELRPDVMRNIASQMTIGV